MRVPMRIPNSINAYLTMKAILIAARSHEAEPPIRTIAIPGLGTGVGGLAPQLAAMQMRQAHQEALGEFKYPGTFAEAQRRHVMLNRGAMLYD